MRQKRILRWFPGSREEGWVHGGLWKPFLIQGIASVSDVAGGGDRGGEQVNTASPIRNHLLGRSRVFGIRRMNMPKDR